MPEFGPTPAYALNKKVCAFSAECQDRRSRIGGSSYCELVAMVKKIREDATANGTPHFTDQVVGEAEIDLLNISGTADGDCGCIQPNQVHHEVKIAERALGITD